MKQEIINELANHFWENDKYNDGATELQSREEATKWVNILIATEIELALKNYNSLKVNRYAISAKDVRSEVRSRPKKEAVDS